MTALKGVRVVDLSRIIAGPSCAQLMADLGADVIKVEDRGGDDNRTWPPLVDGRSTNFLSVNRGKRSLTINLKTPKGRDILDALVRKADVLIENFLPETGARLGLDHARLSSVNPKLIHVSITGYGSRGPMRSQPGYDNMLQAFTGMMAMTGEADRGPARLGTPIIDVSAGMLAFGAVCAALYARSVGNAGGQHIETSLLQTGIALLAYNVPAYTMAGKVAPRSGSSVWHVVPNQVFKTSDGEILTGANNDRVWQQLCRAIGAEAIADDARFATAMARVENRKPLIAALEPYFLKLTTKDCAERLDRERVPNSPVNEVSTALEHPQVKAMNMVLDIPDGHGGTMRLGGVPLDMSGSPVEPGGRPPELGEHTDEILAGELGLDAAAIEALRREMVI